ncbi:DNA-directed RNA polymerase subunit delta [Latilactobacillus fuchuensis]|uniref:Probable DNA-directed RNA polymerase subunit delta n=1 Tax=Latilactobacillus fuchuensis DSM 14340 = JCM 11249 TaxID=1423747 RepID=A0A0R1RWY3_9LACO|nr:DNA-directed RNA polymerase subunit delta [Latilactobacillus fuchuensis]KRL61552.1 rpoE protein [Latilactobacillus fuchuensis DSM 14340 = JCM 11249]MCP8857280.1 DNA-directed RNA polymerase subunit delta [Latilactobacillus fuchuensis]
MYRLKLNVFKGQNKEELSMIEVAHAILEEKGDTIGFADLANEVQKYLGKSDEEVRARLSQFYTDLNEDGSFISLGENVWGLRSWYPYESVDEEVNHPEDEDDQPTNKKKRRKKVNAFLADVTDDDDVIDYSDDDPEDDDLEASDDTELADDESGENLKEYQADLQNIGDDDDDEEVDALEDGIEGQLSEFSDDDDDEEDDDEDDL